MAHVGTMAWTRRLTRLRIRIRGTRFLRMTSTPFLILLVSIAFTLTLLVRRSTDASFQSNLEEFKLLPTFTFFMSHDDSKQVNSSILRRPPQHSSHLLLQPHPSSSESKNAKQNIAIFYNTFVRLNGAQKTRGNRIIKEQLDMIDSQPLLANATVHYSRFGALDIDWPGCGNRTCLEIVAQSEGDEVMTLQPLHEYCVKNPLDRVIYIHSKGTYTATVSNDVLRNVLMKAVTSEECVGMPAKNGTCNACSTQLTAMPFTSYPGNMWVAECAYVRKLIPPKDFEPAKQKIHKDLLNATKQIGNFRIREVSLDNGTTTFKFKDGVFWQITRESWVGVARYAMEHWLGSHPDFKPCDVFSPSDPGTPEITYKAAGINCAALVPRLRVSLLDRNWTDLVLNPWFMQEGKLYEYKALYSKAPDNLSWFSRYFKVDPTYV